MRALAGTVASLLLSPAASACSCSARESYAEQYAGATTVAVVRVVSARLGSWAPESVHDERGKVEATNTAVLSTAQVMEQLKGRLVDPSTVVSPPPNAPCYQALEVGREYVVFASGDSAILHDWCSPLAALEQVPPEILARWRKR